MLLNTAVDLTRLNESVLLAYNSSLEDEALVSRLNEEFLQQKIDVLERITSIFDEMYWLTVARINELTLLCAGNYADNFEFTGAADLLVNPRLVLIHFRNLPKPVVKIRHLRTTEQFRNTAYSEEGVIQWLKKEAFYEIKKKPLLPELYGRLKNSGYISQEYLESADRRMKQIADTIHFLMSWHIHNISDYCQRLQCATQSEREFIESNLCRFDKKTFHQLGYDLRQLIRSNGYESKFFKPKSERFSRRDLKAITHDPYEKKFPSKFLQ